ncbi:MAG: YciI family protein [Betaproteobacteria bacterium]|nr:YciI family protein [Betaproteobacteria bacterium]
MPSRSEIRDRSALDQSIEWELVKAGIMQAGEGLKPSREGKRVKFTGGKTTVVDGPFIETKALIAGYWMWQVKSMDEALAWARKCPKPPTG